MRRKRRYILFSLVDSLGFDAEEAQNIVLHDMGFANHNQRMQRASEVNVEKLFNSSRHDLLIVGPESSDADTAAFFQYHCNKSYYNVAK